MHNTAVCMHNSTLRMHNTTLCMHNTTAYSHFIFHCVIRFSPISYFDFLSLKQNQMGLGGKQTGEAAKNLSGGKGDSIFKDCGFSLEVSGPCAHSVLVSITFEQGDSAWRACYVL
jgi:hypothetical protein